MNENKNVLKFPSKALQGSPCAPASWQHGPYELNNEYVPASNIVRDHIELLKSTLKTISNLPYHMQKDVYASSIFIAAEMALGELALCFDYDNIMIRYPFYKKDRADIRGGNK